MTVTLELTPELAKNLSEGAAGNVTDTETLRKTLRDMLAAMQPATAESAMDSRPRIAGLNPKDIAWISADFDAPLPDALWIGEEDEDI